MQSTFPSLGPLHTLNSDLSTFPLRLLALGKSLVQGGSSEQFMGDPSNKLFL